jgi:hypothetical protein
MPEPGSVVWVWGFQWITFVTGVAVSVSVAVMKGAMTDVKNKALWEDDKNKVPFKVSGNKVTLTDAQTLWVSLWEAVVIRGEVVDLDQNR